MQEKAFAFVETFKALDAVPARWIRLVAWWGNASNQPA